MAATEPQRSAAPGAPGVPEAQRFVRREPAEPRSGLLVRSGALFPVRRGGWLPRAVARRPEAVSFLLDPWWAVVRVPTADLSRVALSSCLGASGPALGRFALPVAASRRMAARCGSVPVRPEAAWRQEPEWASFPAREQFARADAGPRPAAVLLSAKLVGSP